MRRLDVLEAVRREGGQFAPTQRVARVIRLGINGARASCAFSQDVGSQAGPLELPAEGIAKVQQLEDGGRHVDGPYQPADDARRALSTRKRKDERNLQRRVVYEEAVRVFAVLA